MKHALDWFEITVSDLERAKRFYSTVLKTTFTDMPIDGNLMAVFAADEGAVSGALWEDKEHQGAENSVTLYLSFEGDLEEALGRVEAADGKILVGQTLIAEDVGSYARIADPDGNPVGLYASANRD